MKSFFMNSTLSFLTKYNNYSDEEKEKISYGLEGIYLTFTKLFIITILALILGIFQEVILLLILFNFIRYFGFGIHAKKSSHCLISSTLFFICLPFMFLRLNISYNVLLIISLISLISFIPFAPADTPKRPFYNKKKKLIRKIITLIIGVIYLMLSLFIHNEVISKILLLAIIIQAIVVNPITYMLMGQSYNNGKKKDV